ncbi:DUF4301 family protein, partial [Moorena sp. SIO2C4]|uniref:DUF4301 family protein n=1 Tax=Moorena sp. SIO2C4 TaxID=2607824 RepID=UPI0013C6136E
LLSRLYRPLRVCGVVANDGQSGGGPFWVQAPDGVVVKQIVESAQVRMDSLVYRTIIDLEFLKHVDF